jgi:hypothetical protein
MARSSTEICDGPAYPSFRAQATVAMTPPLHVSRLKPLRFPAGYGPERVIGEMAPNLPPIF